MIGLSVTWALSIVSTLAFTIREVAQTEVQMTAVQRVLEYIEQNPQERDFKSPSPSKDNWPQSVLSSRLL